MREIKFRAWIIEEKCWFWEGFSIARDGTFIYDDNLNEYEIENFIIEQFTGIYDKNKKEIFEGDIISYYQPYAKRTDVHVVKWDEMGACFGLFENGNKWCKESDWMKIQDLEIIGNINENPELIT